MASVYTVLAMKTWFTVALPVLCIFCLTFLSTSAQDNVPHITVAHPPGAYAQVNGAKLWYETEGHGEPLVMVPGGPGDSHSVYHPFFSRLADHNRVIYFDAFGVGKSDRARSPKEYTFHRDVEDLEGLRRVLGLTQMNLLGQSFGGMVTQAYALKYPQFVKRLILIDTFYSGQMWQANNQNANNEIRNQYPEVWEELQELRAEGLRSSTPDHQELYDRVPLGLFYFYDASKAKSVPFDPANDQVYYTIAGNDADFSIGGDIAALDFRADLQKLKMPILILAGRFDRISMPRYAIKFKKYAPQAHFVIMEESGHFPYVEEPDKTFLLLHDFLNR
jgi:proline iminopeptidase